jgi:hypothetical protein
MIFSKLIFFSERFSVDFVYHVLQNMLLFSRSQTLERRRHFLFVKGLLVMNAPREMEMNNPIPSDFPPLL